MKSKLIVPIALMLALAACNYTPAGENKITTAQVKPAPPGVREKAETNSPVQEQAMDMAMPVASAGSAAAPAARPVDMEKKIIKEGDIRFETNNVADTRKQILSALKKLGGYTEEDSETTSGDAGSKEYTLNIRIPAKNFDAFVGSVSSTATKIDSRNIRIRDVTTQFIDTKTRLDNKKLLETRYLGLLNKAAKMSDLLEIEGKLTEIRSDIESTQSQLNYMSKQVDYSALSIAFYTKQASQVAAGNGFTYKLKNALGSGWEFLQGLFFGIISLWPLWLTIAVLWLLIKRWAKRNTHIPNS
jgi:hypothetical protein